MSDPLFRTGAPIPANLLDPAQDKIIDLDKDSLINQIAESQERIRLRQGLPFLHGWKWYKWARAFYESKNRINLLCAANQISKSSSLIRRCINHATNQELWPELWQQKPTQFWYLYPTKEQATVEFETKWKQFLPNGPFKDDPYYGWQEEKKASHISAIHFNSGVHVYFKTYAQNAASLQTGTVDELFADEELPMDLFEELMFRISASNGYFNMVFTATLGQDFWRKCMEPNKNEKEELPQAFKQTVSLYDAMFYEDGEPSHWTAEKIALVRARCSTSLEVLKRVYGRFVVLGGRTYESFDIKRHLVKKHPIPKSWFIYAGVDIGSGGEEGHPSAICFVAVKPDYRAGRIFLGWRGDGIQTTSGDVVSKFLEMQRGHSLIMTNKFYDWGNKDFETIATRMGHHFEKADKGHDKGEDIVNTLFKHDMLMIYEDEELVKLAGELATLNRETPKTRAHDDFIDAMRYCLTKIPWDWSVITGADENADEDPEDNLTPMQKEIKQRRQAFTKENEAEQARIDDEFEEWNALYE